jgi:hypothetical protein
MAQHDPSVHAQIVAAEAIISPGKPNLGVERLTSVLENTIVYAGKYLEMVLTAPTSRKR